MNRLNDSNFWTLRTKIFLDYKLRAHEPYDSNEPEIPFPEAMTSICNNWYGVHFENKIAWSAFFQKKKIIS